MTIGSYQALLSLIKNDNIVGVDSLKNCVSQLSKICNCQKSRKSSKSEECNNLYVNFVKASAVNLTSYFSTKTNDETIVFTHGSNHVISTIKLR